MSAGVGHPARVGPIRSGGRAPGGFAVATVFWLACVALPSVSGCSGTQSPVADNGLYANVIAVQAAGTPGDYIFSVAVSSQESGCDRYADWWEITRPDGELVFRRILAHSHTNEQPFTRSGGPVDVRADETLVVRAHMNVDGYGGVAMRGTVADGFAADPAITSRFAAKLADMQPLPDGCVF